MPPVASILCAIVLGVSGQYYVKKGINMIPDIDFAAGLHIAYARIFFSPSVLAGIALYFISVFFWLYALTKVDLSYASPFLALTYVLMVVVSWLFLGETITWLRWLGLFVVIIGVVIVSLS